jgi:hypothetical protein
MGSTRTHLPRVGTRNRGIAFVFDHFAGVIPGPRRTEVLDGVTSEIVGGRAANEQDPVGADKDQCDNRPTDNALAFLRTTLRGESFRFRLSARF